MDEYTMRQAVPVVRQVLGCLDVDDQALCDDEIVYALRTRGRALLDALGHSPDCVAPDHYRKVWQEERDRALRIRDRWWGSIARLAALSADADADAGRCPQCDRTVDHRFLRWGKSTAACEDCDDAEPGTCGRCDGAGAIPPLHAKGTLWKCTRCHGTGEYPPPSLRHGGPSRAEGDEPGEHVWECGCIDDVEADGTYTPAVLCDYHLDAEGGRPREADPQGPSIGSDASVDGGGDDSHSVAGRWQEHAAHLTNRVRELEAALNGLDPYCPTNCCQCADCNAISVLLKGVVSDG